MEMSPKEITAILEQEGDRLVREGSYMAGYSLRDLALYGSDEVLQRFVKLLREKHNEHLES